MKKNILIIMFLSLALVACSPIDTTSENISDKIYQSNNKIQTENLINIEELLKSLKSNDIYLAIETEGPKGNTYYYNEDDVNIQASTHLTKDKQEKVNSLNLQIQGNDVNILDNSLDKDLEGFIPEEIINWFSEQVQIASLDFRKEEYVSFTSNNQIGDMYTQYIINGHKDEYLSQEFKILWSMASSAGDNLKALAADMEGQGLFIKDYIEGYMGDSIIIEDTANQLSYNIMYEPKAHGNPYSIQIKGFTDHNAKNILTKLEGIDVIKSVMGIEVKELERMDQSLESHINKIHKNKNSPNQMFLSVESTENLSYEIGIEKYYGEEEGYNYSVYISSI